MNRGGKGEKGSQNIEHFQCLDVCIDFPHSVCTRDGEEIGAKNRGEERKVGEERRGKG